MLPQLRDPIMVYTPKANSYANQACPQRDEVRVAITVQTIFAISLPVGQDDRMPVIDMAINQIEDVTEENRSKCHAAPILTQAIHTEGFSNECWVDAEEKAVG